MWSYAYAFFMPTSTSTSTTSNSSDRRLLEQQQGDLEKYTNHMHSQVHLLFYCCSSSRLSASL